MLGDFYYIYRCLSIFYADSACLSLDFFGLSLSAKLATNLKRVLKFIKMPL